MLNSKQKNNLPENNLFHWKMKNNKLKVNYLRKCKIKRKIMKDNWKI